MDFQARLAELSEKIRQSQELVRTEEATKSAYIMPFLQLLGYDVFSPLEVVPEYTADVGIKKGEKADYAVLRDGLPVMLIECKCCGTTLNAGKCSQLFRYFHTIPSARIGILTNGVQYLFFTDLDKPNVMDMRPFMEFDFLTPDKTLFPELRKLSKASWDIVAALSAATELKYTRALKSVLAGQLQSPDDEFVRLLASKVYEGKLTANIREMFSGLVKRAFQQLVSDMINDRLTSAMVATQQQDEATPAESTATQIEPISKVATSEEEHEAYHLVKAILRREVEPKRITMRDTQSYCGVLLDDNNRKPICRLHFNGKQKYIGLFNADKVEERIQIAAVDDIFTHSEKLKKTISFYDRPEASA